MYNITDFQYMLSLYCPGECVNCGIWRYSKDEITKNEIDLNLFEKVIQANYLKNANYIQLTGGEVQLSPKYIGAVEIISKYKKDAFIHTNISGWYPKTHYDVTKESLKYIKKENFRIDISLDGKEKTYSKIRLVKNGFTKVIDTVNRLKEITNNLRFVFTIYKQNFMDMQWAIDFAKKMEIDIYFEFARESDFLNNSGKISDSMDFNEDEIEHIEKILNKINFINRSDRAIKWQRAKSIYRGNNQIFSCNMGNEAVIMNPYGEIYPCLETNNMLKMGNIKEFDGNLDKLLDSQKALNVIEIIKNKKCQPCGMLCVHKLEA